MASILLSLAVSGGTTEHPGCVLNADVYMVAEGRVRTHLVSLHSDPLCTYGQGARVHQHNQSRSGAWPTGGRQPRHDAAIRIPLTGPFATPRDRRIRTGSLLA